MTRRRPHLLALRPAAALGLSAAFLAMTAPVSHALGLPEPVRTAVAPLTSPAPEVTGGLGLPVPGSTTPVSGPGSPAVTGRPSPTATQDNGPAAASTTPSPPASSTPTGSSTTRGSSATGASRPTPATGAVVDSPAATVCLIPAGTSSPAVQVDLRAAGVDLSSPLVEQFPQAFAPCPTGAVPAGQHVVSVDAAIEGLLGACVRVTRRLVPVQTTLVVLDRNLVEELTGAGVPLESLVVPCPGADDPPAVSGVALDSDPARADSTGTEQDASALPAHLAFTGSEPVPAALVGAGLLWLGVLLTRRARAAVNADGVRG